MKRSPLERGEARHTELAERKRQRVATATVAAGIRNDFVQASRQRVVKPKCRIR
jgi:hypothetical protein